MFYFFNLSKLLYCILHCILPLYKKISLHKNSILAIWKISESKEQLLALISERLNDATKPINAHDNIGKHWLASRALLLHLFDKHNIEIKKDKYNKPSLVVGGKKYFIAISHSNNFAAIIFSNMHEVGIDIEKIDKRITRVAHKFISNDEAKFAHNNNIDDTTLCQTIIWCAKETMYKIYGKKELDFIAHMSIDKFAIDDKIITGSVNKNNEQIRLHLCIQLIEDYVLCYSTKAN